MWRPATRAVTGTNDVPVANKRRFGLPEDAPPPSNAPPTYNRPAAQDIQYFNGRIERDRKDEPAMPPPPSRDPYAEVKREDYKYDDRRGRDEAPRSSRWDSRDDRGAGPPGGGGGGGGYDRDRDYDRNRDRERDRERDRDRRRDDDRGRDGGGGGGEEPRKRKSRWGDASTKVDAAPGLPTAVLGNVSQVELDNYAIHVRLEEISRKLRTGDVIPPPGQRSPSPPPQYDAYGRRTNTLDIRYRKKLEDERTRLIDRAMKADPNFRPPADMSYASRNSRPQEKVYIPVKEFPEINFFGLLVGPRGNSLKRMERESGAKISIRGKGSVKEGKARDGRFAEDENDELHCLVMADDAAAVKRCVDLINKVIETAASTPEGQNDHKRNQLRELASLNGTLRDDENQLCQNCGEKGHRKWECPQQRVYSANVICRLCGGAGHMARDCRGRGDPNQFKAPGAQPTAFDSEYASLMAELGEGATGIPAGAIGGAPVQSAIPPWRIPENWTQNAWSRAAQAGGYGAGTVPHQGFNQQHQNHGYGYGPPVASGPPGADPYASYYANMGQ